MTFEERILAPIWWWLAGLGIVASVALAVFAYVEPWQAIVLVSLSAVVVLVGLWALTMRVRVGHGALVVGRFRLEAEYIAGAAATDRDGGAAIDRHAFFLTRPFAKHLVRVTLDDPADPHTAWLISTNRPDDLASAIEALQEQ